MRPTLGLVLCRWPSLRTSSRVRWGVTGLSRRLSAGWPRAVSQRRWASASRSSRRKRDSFEFRGVLCVRDGCDHRAQGSHLADALYAVLSLTVIRMPPLPSPSEDRAFPATPCSSSGGSDRGARLHRARPHRSGGGAQVADRGLIQVVVVATVLLSVLAHGITAAPLSEVFARRSTPGVKPAPDP